VRALTGAGQEARYNAPNAAISPLARFSLNRKGKEPAHHPVQYTIWKWMARVPACFTQVLVRELSTSGEVTRRDKSPGENAMFALLPAVANRPFRGQPHA
jgi:hypothetical protein